MLLKRGIFGFGDPWLRSGPAKGQEHLAEWSRQMAFVKHVLLIVGSRSSEVTALLGCSYTSRQATYDLRRLKRKGLIVRLSGHRRYQLTPLGRRVAVLFTKVYGRVISPGLARLDPRLPTDLVHRSDLAGLAPTRQKPEPIHKRSAHRSLNPNLV